MATEQLSRSTNIVADIRKKAAALKKKIVLPEGEEKRTLKAAAILKKDGLCVPILLGNPEKAKKVAAENGADISGIEIVDIQLGWFLALLVRGKNQQQPQRVPVRGERIRTDLALTGQAVREECLQGRGQCGHASPPR